MSFTGGGLEAADIDEFAYAMYINGIIQALKGNLVREGLAVTPYSGLTVTVASGKIATYSGTTTYLQDVTGANVDFTTEQGALAVTESIFYFLYIDSAGVIQKLTGVASTGDPYPPAYDDNAQVIIARIRLTYGDSSVDTADIRDVRISVPKVLAVLNLLKVYGDLDITETLSVTGTSAFGDAVTLADAKNIKLTKGNYTASLQAPTMTSNVVNTLPPGTGTLGLVSDSNYHVYSETEVKANYAVDMNYAAGVLKNKNFNGVVLGTGITLTDYFYTETEMDTLLTAKATKISVLGDSTTNLLYIPAIFEISDFPLQINYGDNGWGSNKALLNVYSTNEYPRLKYMIPLACKKGGKSLFIENISIKVTGTATNYITNTRLFGNTEVVGAQAEIDVNSTNIGDTGDEFNSLLVQENCGSFVQVFVELELVSYQTIKIYQVVIEHYYV